MSSSVALRDELLSRGILSPLLSACTPQASVALLRSTVACLESFTRHALQCPFSALSPMLPVLARLLFVIDDDVLTHSLAAVAALSDDATLDHSQIQSVIESGVSRRAVELLVHVSLTVQTAALTVVCNLVSGTDAHRQALIDCGVLPCLLALLVNPRTSIRLSACVAIARICAGSADQIERVISTNFIRPLVSILRNEEFALQQEAAWALVNAITGGSDAQIRLIVSAGVIPPLCEQLTCADDRVIMAAMEGLASILRVGQADAATDPQVHSNPFANLMSDCNGLDYLEALQHHESEEVSQRAKAILTEYVPALVAEDRDEADSAEGGASGEPIPATGSASNSSVSATHRLCWLQWQQRQQRRLMRELRKACLPREAQEQADSASSADEMSDDQSEQSDESDEE